VCVTWGKLLLTKTALSVPSQVQASLPLSVSVCVSTVFGHFIILTSFFYSVEMGKELRECSEPLADAPCPVSTLPAALL